MSDDSDFNQWYEEQGEPPPDDGVIYGQNTSQELADHEWNARVTNAVRSEQYQQQLAGQDWTLETSKNDPNYDPNDPGLNQLIQMEGMRIAPNRTANAYEDTRRRLDEAWARVKEKRSRRSGVTNPDLQSIREPEGPAVKDESPKGWVQGQQRRQNRFKGLSEDVGVDEE
jgi:hypothetical protein